MISAGALNHLLITMLFTLDTTGSFYEKDQAEKLEKLGFKFQEYKTGFFKGKIFSIDSDCVEIKIDTLEELLAFAKEYGQLIIDFPSIGEGQPNIEIYDDYRE